MRLAHGQTRTFGTADITQRFRGQKAHFFTSHFSPRLHRRDVLRVMLSWGST
jgi:hypothetical protein